MMSGARDRLLAAPWHTAVVVAALAVNAYTGFVRSGKLRTAVTVDRPMIYGRTILVEWLVFGLVLGGVSLHNSPLGAVLGERWRSPVQFLQDLGIAVAFVVVSVLMTSLLGAHGHAAATDPAVKFLMPATGKEKWLWVLVALSAGICEEAVYRGYLQQQFAGMTGSIPVGIVLSAVLFGASHAYQGVQPALIIAFGGLLSGLLAWWRKSVRPGMIAHTLQDLLALVVPH